MTDNKKCKVLHLVHVMGHGGIETFLMSMLRCFDRERFHMDIAYCGPQEGAYADEVRKLGCNLISCSMGIDQLRFMSKFAHILRKGDYNAVNTHLSDMGGGAILTAKMCGIPARVASYHTNLVKRRAIKKFYLETMRRIIVRTSTDITTSSPDVSESHFTRIPAGAGMVHPISYGVDTARFSEDKIEPLDLKDMGVCTGDILIGHVGRFVPQKNHIAIVNIASIVVKQFPRVKFILCAKDGSLKSEVMAKISESGLSKYFVFVRGIDDMRRFYKTIDIFILPSSHEGMPVSIIEAQAAAKPIIASRLGGIEIATCGQAQENLFAVNDIKSFSQCLIDLLSDKEKRHFLGEAGRRYVREKFDISIAVRKYERLYLNQKIAD
ncbi:MAG: glycosyltransferase [Sedimentisphaerales bacterium]|nr:glycosyltransferase [Sedimentisphaerales bacterium]